MSTATAMTQDDGYRPSDDEEFMNERQLDYFRRKLLQWKDDILRESRETVSHLPELPFDFSWQPAGPSLALT